MAMNYVAGLVQLVMLWTIGGGAGLPLGIPPAAEDPVASRVAPKECLLYLSWSGVAQPDPSSPNQTEQLLAEKEIQEFLAQMESRIVEMARGASPDDPEAAALVEPIAALLKAVLTHPAAVFIEQIDPNGGQQALRGGALVRLGSQAAEVEQTLARIEAALADPAALAEPTPWRRASLGGDGPVVEWGIRDGYLILGVGEGEADKIVARTRQEPPAWLAQLRQELVVPRPAKVFYVNVAGLLASPIFSESPEGRASLKAFGLDRVQSVANVSGLDEKGCLSKTQIAIEGDPRGLLSVFAGPPLSRDDLAVIPRDATLALAARFDLAKFYQETLNVAGQLEPETRDELLGVVGQFEERMKIKLCQDIFESLGDTWRVYNSPSEGGFVITGLTAVVNLRDRDRLVAANGKLVMSAFVGGTAGRMTGADGALPVPPISQFQFGGQMVFCANGMYLGIPIMPAWCITEKELVVAFSPQNVRAYLSRSAATGSLADVPAVADLFAGGEPPLVVGYCDMPELLKLFYPIMQLYVIPIAGYGFQIADESWHEGALLFPSALSIVRHLQPTASRIRRTGDGVVIETRRTLPVSPVGGFLAICSLDSAFSPFSPWESRLGDLPTRQSRSLNNLRQIALALHVHHDAKKSLPPAAAPRQPGQPPVSWRVLVLPYVGREALYEQYHFDEPWDSPNNLKVAAQMPAVFKAPGSKAAAEGKTNYLAVVGEEHVFAADRGRSFTEIPDGTSNTILVVEVGDERAVPWTKPDDFTPDKTKPIAGLVGLRAEGFLAALADGSVRRFPATIDAASLLALFTRAGGESSGESGAAER